MNIQLFFENQEVEIDSKVSFPLTKSFDNLLNPTDITIEYSKSIKIPATAANNKLMANAYRIDKKFTAGGSKNIGMYLDPMKRIQMKLIHNGSLLLEGYAKYVSATVNNKETYYTFNLYGVIGEVFKTLQSVVLSTDKLSDEQKAESDGGAKYVLDDLMDSHPIIDKALIKTIWENEPEPLIGGNSPENIIGFAPAYRGLYDNFEANSIVGLETVTNSDGTPKSVSEVLKEEWVVNLTNAGTSEEDARAKVDAIDFESIIGSGISEHALRQFRSYEQKPYVYFCRLMEMYQRKCKELTDYEIELDKKWFNINNPYWSKICYMLDYLAGRGVNDSNTQPFSGYSNGGYSSTSTENSLKSYSRSVSYTFPTEITNMGAVRVAPFNVLFINKRAANDNDPLWSGKGGIQDSVIELSPRAHITCKVVFTNSGGNTKTFYWWGAEDSSVTPVSTSQYNSDNFNKVYNETVIDRSARTLTGTTALLIPSMDLKGFNTNGLKMTITAYVWYPTTSTNEYEIYRAPFIYRHRNPLKGSTTYNQVNISTNNSDYTITFPNTEVYSNWRYTTTCALKNLYTKDESLFNVILQYTKMFGLIWKADYDNKKITIMPRQSYFGNYDIVDWTDKFDGTKDCVIEPCSFNAKYVDFNYEDIDGYRYKGYSNRYGVGYGGKHIKTKYDFDSKTTNLFKGIHPSSVSTKSYIYIPDLISWDTTSKIQRSVSEISFIDCEDMEQEKSITMNNWYFRLNNFTPTENYYVSDVSAKEKEDGKYYWLFNSYGIFQDDKPVVKVNSLPQFSVAINTADTYNKDGRTVGCLFNCPNEDFTADNSVAAAKDNYIYDLYWRNFINERYNSNNKKVTAYFNLSAIDYNLFNFNKFVVFNNQLFVVNKIYDFNPTSNTTTKVELIQVSNIDSYIGNSVFPIITTNVSGVFVEGEWGSKTINVRCYPSPDDQYIYHETTLPSGASVYIEDIEHFDDKTGITITWEGFADRAQYKGVLVVKSGGYELELPIEING